jgi:hypothetical protein
MSDLLARLQQVNKRTKICAAVYSGAFSLSLTMGYSLDNLGELVSPISHPMLLLRSIALFVIAYFMTLFIWSAFSRPSKDHSQKIPSTFTQIEHSLPEFIKNIRSYFTFVFIYTAFLLSLYPGFFVYDATTVLHFYQRNELTTHHPIFHSVLMPAVVEGVYKLSNSYNLGIAIWMFIQILVISGVNTFMLSEFRRKKLPIPFIVCSAIFLSCFPTIIMYVLCSVSDSMFCFFLTLASILLLSLFSEPELFWSSMPRKVMLVLSLTLMVLFRKNGFYAFIVFIPFFLIANRKRLKNALIIAILPVVLFLGITNAMETATHAAKAGAAEPFSIPLQQLARVYEYHEEELSEKDLELILKIQPKERWDMYAPRLADELKEFADMDQVKNNLPEYASLYTRLFFRFPMEYINGWLLTTYEQWYPHAVYDCYHGGQYDDCCYFGYMVEEPGSKQPQWERLDMLFRWFSLSSVPHKTPVLRLLFAPGAYFLIFLFCIAYSFQKKWYYNVLAMLLMFLVYLTVLLGPCALVRYVAYLFFMGPLYVSTLFKQ